MTPGMSFGDALELMVEADGDRALSALHSFANERDSHVDARRIWLRFGLVVVGCAIGGLGIGYLGAAIVVNRFLNPQ